MNDTNKMLKRQVRIAIAQFVIWVLCIISLSIMSFCIQDDSETGELSGMSMVSIVLTSIFSLAALIVWIIGIVGAVKINNAFGGAGSLIVFSIIPLIIAHWISAARMKSRHINKTEKMIYHKENDLRIIYWNIPIISLIFLFSMISIFTNNGTVVILSVLNLILGFGSLTLGVLGIVKTIKSYVSFKVLIITIYVLMILMPLSFFVIPGIMFPLLIATASAILIYVVKRNSY